MNMMLKRGVKSVVAAAILITPVAAFGASKLIVKGTDGATDKFVATDEGSVGIGVTTPAAGLHLKGNAYPYASVRTQFEGTTSGGGGGFLAYHNNASGALPLNNDRLGYFLFGALNGITPMHAAGVSVHAESNWTTASTPSYFTFATTPAGSTSRVERLRVTGAGNIGVGTAAPTQKLEVSGGVRLNTASSKPACDANARGTLWFTRGGTGVADAFDVCVKDASENYLWVKLN